MIEIIDQGARMRNAAFWSADDGCIVAGDQEGDDLNLAQSLIFEVAGNQVASYRLIDWIAHAVCRLPGDRGALVAGDTGRLLTVEPGTIQEGQVAFADHEARAIVLRSLRLIDERVHAVGMSGMVARRRIDGLWDSLVDPVPSLPGLEAIDGFSADELYAVGWKGALVEVRPSSVLRHTTPTSVILTDIACAGDGQAYACGQNGVLLRGRHARWEIICDTATQENLWSVAYFGERIYVATILALYTIQNDALVPVDFGDDPPTTCYKLFVAKGYLWSVGREDLLRFDGVGWLRVA